MRRKRKPKNLFAKKLFEWSRILLIATIIAVVIHQFFFVSVQVQGTSMFPTLAHGDRLITNVLDYRLGRINRFDIIAFRVSEDLYYVKRIIAFGGEHVEFRADKLYINGVQYDEPFLDEIREFFVGSQITPDFELKEETGKLVVPENHYFVVGDNRRRSIDSRNSEEVGFVSQEDIIGTANFIFYPLRHMQILSVVEEVIEWEM